MADLTEETISAEWLKNKKRILVKVKSASQNDTVTFSSYTKVLGACLMQEDGTAVTCTVATNVVTITQAISNVDVWGLILVKE